MNRCLILLLCVPIIAGSSTGQAAQAAQEKSVAEILWDTWGVPHIFATDEASGFRAFGRAQMQSHVNLLPELFAKARGRGAEYFGQKHAASDRAVRTMGLPALAAKWYEEQTPQFKKDLDAFAAGINEYAAQNETKLNTDAKAVLPVTAVDVLAHTIRVLYGFESAVAGCTEALPDGVLQGSNAWAIGPSHSASGRAMLLANPHLPWSGEMLFYEAQITTPEYSAYGVALVGFPVLIIAFNDSIAWTHTVNTIDLCDMYTLKLDGDGYDVDGKKLSFQTDTETMKIRQADGSAKEESITVRRSIQGPVVDRQGQSLALRVAGLQAGSFSGALDEWWQMGRAKNLAEFQMALQRMQLPMFNAVYAGSDQHILLMFNGLEPVRTRGDALFWSKPVAGDDSTLVWSKIHSYADLPKVVDPPAGWVQNSNSAPWYMTEPFLDPDKYPPYLSPRWDQPGGAPSIREQRGLRMLTQEAKISFEHLIADKYSGRSEMADRILADLTAAAKKFGDESAKRAATVLEQWDHETNSDSRGAFLFRTWMGEMRKQLPFTAEPFDPKRPLDTPRGLKDPQLAAQTLGSVAAALEMQNGGMKVAWGERVRLRRGRVDLPANGGPGNLGIFRVIETTPGPGDTLTAMGGDSFVAAIEFSKPLRAKVILTYGNSSDPNSPHYGDQLLLSAKKELRDPWRTRSEIEKHLEGRTILGANGSVHAK